MTAAPTTLDRHDLAKMMQRPRERDMLDDDGRHFDCDDVFEPGYAGWFAKLPPLDFPADETRFRPGTVLRPVGLRSGQKPQWRKGRNGRNGSGGVTWWPCVMGAAERDGQR